MHWFFIIRLYEKILETKIENQNDVSLYQLMKRTTSRKRPYQRQKPKEEAIQLKRNKSKTNNRRNWRQHNSMIE